MNEQHSTEATSKLGNSCNFTKQALSRLPLPAQGTRAVYRDTKTPGLQLRITSNGIKTFSIYRRTKGGTPERITLGRFPAMTVEQARIEAAKANAEIAAGGNPAKVRRAIKGELTFSDLFSEYMKCHSKPKKLTWREDEGNYRRHLAKPLGALKTSHITRQKIAAIHDRITASGKKVMANRVLALASSVFGWGISNSRCDENPAKGIKLNKEISRDRYLQEDEMPRFFRALGEEPNETMRDYFVLSLLTGARRSNVLAMRWADINLDRGEWRIPRTKNGEPQTVTLSAEAIQILKDRKPTTAGEFVFPGIGKSKHLVEPRKGWERVFDRDELNQIADRIKASGNDFSIQNEESLSDTLKRARSMAEALAINLEGTRISNKLLIHDLRRTLGSWQLKQGASLAIIGKSLNHKSQQATAIYARLNNDPVRASVNSATAAMMEAAGVKKRASITPIR